MSKYKTYDSSQKIKICKMIIEDNINTRVIAEQYGIKNTLIYNWLDNYRKYGDEAFVGSGKLRTQDAEMKKIKKENEELKMELEILKKAAAYYLNQNKSE